jgi:hypothetical protein
MTADDGTANQILLTDTVNQTYWDALVQNSDSSKRWYPVHNVKNPTTERAESVKFTYDDGTTIALEDGARTYQLILNQMSFTFLAKLKQWECITWGIVPYDIDGRIMMEMNTAGTALIPIKASANTLDTIYKFATSTEPAQIQFGFQVDKNVKDYQLKMVLPSEMDNIDVADSAGLFDVNGSHASITTTTWTSTLTTDYGTFMNPTLIKGLVTGDFTITQTAPTAAAVTLTSATENPANSGIYDFVIVAETSGDVLHIAVDETKGYDSTGIADVVIP